MLDYSSERALARGAERTLYIPVIGSTVPSGLTKITLEVDVAGQTFSQDITSFQPNLTETYTWDGKDAYGRTLTSVQNAAVHLRQYVNSFYQIPTGGGTFSFGQLGSGTPTTVTARSNNEIEVVFTVPIGTQSAKDEIAGWPINVHHFFDPQTKTLYFGDGSNEMFQIFCGKLLPLPTT